MDALKAFGGFLVGLLTAAGIGLLIGFSVAGKALLWLAVAAVLGATVYTLSRPSENGFYKGGMILGLCVGGLLVGLCFNALRNI